MRVKPGAARRELTIESLAVGGEGVAHAMIAGRSRAVFVPQVAPGERVLVDLDASTSPARGQLVEVLTPSASRRPAPCPHALRCGGCPWMFLDDEARREARRRLLDDALLRPLGDAVPAHVVMHDAPAQERYRQRARLGVSARGQVRVGYRAPRSRHLIEIDSCCVLVPPLEAVLAPLRAWLRGVEGEGEVSLALGRGGRPVVELRWERGSLPPTLFGALERAVGAGEIAGASVWLEGAREPALIGDPTVWSEGPEGRPLETPSFAQANPAVTARIAARLRELAGVGRASVVELFAGAGTFTVALAPGQLAYTAVEADARSCAAARRNLAARGLTVRVVEADAEAFAVPARTSLVVLDPPRAGARRAMQALAGARVEEVLYVSCDPVTLARDLRDLVAQGYVVQAIEAFDMFPQTSHLEVVVQARRG